MEMRRFLVCPYPEEVGLAPSRAAEVIRDEKNERMVPTEAVGCMLAATGKAKWKSLLESASEIGVDRMNAPKVHHYVPQFYLSADRQTLKTRTNCR